MRRIAVTVATFIIAAGMVLTSFQPTPARADDGDRWDFESDEPGAIPAGCLATQDGDPAVVTDEESATGDNSLLLADAGADRSTGIRCVSTARAGADLRFTINPHSLSDGLRISVLGEFIGIDRPDTPIFQLWITADGSIYWWDGLPQSGFPSNAESLGWTQLAQPGAVPTGTWSTITVMSTPEQQEASIYVSELSGGHPLPQSFIASFGPVGVTPVERITGFELATIDIPAHEASGVDRVFIDDISFGDGRSAVPPPPSQNLAMGEFTLIDSTSEGLMQMPNSAITRQTRDGGQEVIVTYPVHGDATQDTGTAMAASTDGGRTWRDVSERNPFGSEHSFYLTALPNGDLLAVNYHTFMVEGSGERQAIVPTAISSDGGRSWTVREGTMSTPQAMRAISDGTSRPGSRLGGFVLVQSAVVGTDGTLYQSGYGYYAGDQRYRSIVMTSKDDGENWVVQGTIGVNDGLSDHPRYEGFAEPALAFASDGSLVAVMRTGNYQPLHFSRSNDRGQTWETPQPVVAGPDSIPITGVFPDLQLMDNGTLVMWAGRPGQFLLTSPDGTGDHWCTPASVDYRNSGNGTLTPISDDVLLTFGDRGADWTPNTNPVKEIWVRPVVVADTDC